ncbi:hypothetical protein I4U23_013488 [Adineta vaga]|nr:hypothetical protein I4U23_013488 [Adineta vaga]
MNDEIGTNEKAYEEELFIPSSIDEESIIKTINNQQEISFLSKPLIAEDIFPSVPSISSNLIEYPGSYRTNSKKEESILIYAENFRHQYHHIYRHRKPLLLCPFNECGVQKFVCTTIRMTMLPYSDLTDWRLAAEFLADHLNYDLLNPSYELSRILYSPSKILVEQHGNCFDYANLLCSLLIGAGYDAYIVSGYATREICYMDTTRLQNPYSRKQEKEYVEQLNCQCKKYVIKPPKDLTSKYDAYMQHRHVDALEVEKSRIQDEEKNRKAEIERPLDDPLYGIRIHAWILVLPGKRDITEPFYIESTTGYAKATDDSEYLGIESVWNNQNFWINMQDCSDGCKSLQFDLNDQVRWECMFPHSINSNELITNNHHSDDDENEDKLTDQRSFITLSNQIDWFEKMKFYFNNPLNLPVSNINAISYYNHYSDQVKSEIYERYYTSAVPNIITKNTSSKDIDLPPSWVHPLDITPKSFNYFQKRFPNAHKTYYFKKTCVQKYAPYSMKDGIVLKVSEFNDYDFKELIYMTCQYEYRYDKLEIREHDVKINTIYEKYRPGRNDHLKEYIYNFESFYDRTMIFYHKSRLDSLAKRHETCHELTDYFIDHENFLFSRKTIFESQSKTKSPSHKVIRRSIISITEKSNRNPKVNSNDDIHELIYAIKDNKFILTYHRDVNCITPSIRTYIKPENWNDKTFVFKWNDDLQKSYQADEDCKELSQRNLYLNLIKLIEQEEVIKQVRISEDEIRELQSCRQQEELVSDLEISIYDIDRDEKSKIYKELLEQKSAQDKHNKSSDELDYLAPYLAAIGNPERIDAQTAERIRYKVELDFKHQSIQRANLIQSHYEREIKELMTKHDLNPQSQQAKFRLEILEQRLKEQQNISQKNYFQLQNKLHEDPRLKDPYIVR